MKVELHGLEVFGRHGVLAEERRDGQTFLFDVQLEIAEPAVDTIGSTVDYREVAAAVEAVCGAQSFDLLESLAVAVADVLVERFPVAEVRVRARKQRLAGVPAEWSAATATRSSSR